MDKLIDNNKFLIAATLIVFAMLLCTSGFYGLAETSEARYAEISREMLVTGDFLHPQLFGIFHYHKPPITYWITALGYYIFGINEFGARFFLQVAIVSQLVMVFYIGKLIFNKKVGFYSAITYLAFPIVLISSRNLTTDAYLTTFIVAAIYSWLIYIKNNKIFGLYHFYVLIGFAILTKGPVALIFIVVFVYVYRWQNKLKWKFTIHHFLGLVLCLFIASSWYLLMIKDVSNLLDYFIHDQLLKRIGSNSYNRANPFWFYIPLVVAILLPWLLLLLTKKKNLFRKISFDKNDKSLLFGSFIIFLLFSVFKTKLILYLLPMFWMLAIPIGHQVNKLSGQKLTRLSSIFLYLTLAIAVAPIILSLVQSNYFDLTLGLWLVTILIVMLAFGANHAFRHELKLRFVVHSITFSVLLLTLSQQVLIENPQYSNSIKPIVNKINSLNNGESKGNILVYNYLLSSISFYSNLNTVTLHYDHNTTKRDVRFQQTLDWKNNLINLKDKNAKVQFESICSKGKVYMLVRKKRPIPNELAYLNKSFSHHLDYPKWILYYN